ncbi:FliM/FliN family flagellar motor C-terminal domain-containing protein [Ponticaulis sp.]|uniref:FliM/FliN family flagellar motor C-terminal domain-containing protein n=1 Tax=Ponticaulis sp. TaxID=2020902 RepID=UPI000B74C970|nr:FliM/FliN family flagellar motor C-terminal domain-containing protein [Ponticaulis sp.]MAJ07464.1 hypothetical protein [Ponticaulis sp.]RPG17698.1 MAG: FliM/FliN family flagellar motor switch protein [Hyphomonadaceae bacterium TMED125]HBJ93911.1 hypothetical protein [Hyphomonadaceae bacterium]
MTVIATDWLPDSALLDDRVSGYACDLFSRAFKSVAKKESNWICMEQSLQFGQPCGSDMSSWADTAGDFVLGVPDGYGSAIADHILGSDLRQLAKSAADNTFLRSADEGLLDLFVASVGRQIQRDLNFVEETEPKGNSLVLRLRCDALQVEFMLCISSSQAIRLRKELVKPDGRQQKPQLHSMSQALRNERVRTGAYVGSVELSMADFRDLVSGDTLVIDTPCDAALSLTANGKLLPEVSAEVQSSETKNTLKLVAN